MITVKYDYDCEWYYLFEEGDDLSKYTLVVTIENMTTVNGSLVFNFVCQQAPPGYYYVKREGNRFKIYILTETEND